MDLEVIRCEIFRFRKACEAHADAIRCGKIIEDGYFQSFPKGFCDNASALLAQHLNESLHIDYSRMTIVYGLIDSSRGHAWLEINDHVIDITEDQFSGHSLTILKSASTWHTSIANQREPLTGVPFDSSCEGLERLRMIQTHL